MSEDKEGKEGPKILVFLFEFVQSFVLLGSRDEIATINQHLNESLSNIIKFGNFVHNETK